MNMRHLSLIALPAFMLMLSSGTCQRTENTTKSMKIYKDSTVVEYVRRTAGWVAGAGAFSIPISDGRTIRVLVESYLNDLDPQQGNILCLTRKGSRMEQRV